MDSVQYFSSGPERAGLALIGLSGLLSALSTLSLLAYITWNAYHSSSGSGPHHGLRTFVQSSLGCYFLSLLLCDFIQGTAFSMNFEWSAEGVMRVGTTCTIQGVVSQVGDLGTTVWSLVISFHTFSLLFLVHKPNRLIAPVVLVLGWALIILIPILGPAVQTKEKGPFYGPTGAWCWVSAPYGAERLLFFYIWVFAALGSSVVIYILIYLRFAKIIIVNENRRFKFQWRLGGATLKATNIYGTRFGMPGPGRFNWGLDITQSGTMPSTMGTSSDPTDISTTAVCKDLKQVACRLMWYPIVYGIVVIPVSICRMGVLAGWTPSFGLYLFAGICFAGSGTANSILFIFTRHSFFKKAAQTRIHIKTQQIIVCEDDAGNAVEFAPIQPLTNPIRTSSGFMDRPFAAILGTK